MDMKIRRVVVLGSGVMGSQIATQLAGAGIKVHLLDLSSEKPSEDKALAELAGENFRSTVAISALERLKGLRPNPLYSLNDLQNIVPGNFNDDLSVVAEADWVIEAVIEKLEIKKKLHKSISEYCRPGVPVTTNTSSLLLKDIIEDLPEDYQKSFFGTHYFNPPRYMALVELIPHGLTDKKMLRSFASWLEDKLGKEVVYARDTVNFIANRIGCFNLQAKLKYADEFGLNIETVDALTGKLIGHPSSATFRTLDVIGIDTYSFVTENVYKKAISDSYRDYFKTPDWIAKLIASGACGQKSGKGFYQKSNTADGKKSILVFRDETGEYADQAVDTVPWLKEASTIRPLAERLKFIFKHDDSYANFLWYSLRDTLAYSAMLVDEIAGGSPLAIDASMRFGYNWELGPFEIWQSLGYNEIAKRMTKEGLKLPKGFDHELEFYTPEPSSIEWNESGPTQELLLSADSLNHSQFSKKTDLIRNPRTIYLPKSRLHGDDNRIVLKNKSASLVDLGHGIACLVFHSKMNAMDNEILEQIQASVAAVNQSFQGLVIANNGPCFSAGANLKTMLDMIDGKDYTGLDRFIRNFQGSLQLLKFAPFPTISCPHGMTLGGGCEVTLHTHHVFAHSETYTGLVEKNVGLIPAGGGTKELALRAYDIAAKGKTNDPMPFINVAFENIFTARMSSSAKEAIENQLYKETTHVTLAKHIQTYLAKTWILSELEFGFIPTSPVKEVKTVGKEGISYFSDYLSELQSQNKISEHDKVIGLGIARVLCGGDNNVCSEQGFLDLEREVFIELCKTSATRDRMAHMLEKGRPLRN